MRVKIFGGLAQNIKKLNVNIVGKNSRQKYIIISISAFVLILVFGAFVVLRNNRNISKESSVDCAYILKTANDLMGESKYSEAYDLLTKDYTICVNGQNNDTAFRYDTALAIATYKKGDREKGKHLAQESLDISQKLSSADRQKIANYESLTIRLADIVDGNYSGIGGAN